MVCQTANEAIANANQYSSCQSGQCLKYTRTWLEVNSRYPSAASAWENADGKHQGDLSPRRGAPVFWTGGSRGYGHIALCVTDSNDPRPKVRSTDVPRATQVGTVEIAWLNKYWGLHYAGWAETLNGVLIPYLDKPEENWRASGKVYVSQLKQGVQDSDSVSRLRYRLHNTKDVPNTHDPGLGNDYGPQVVKAVRFWQRNIMRKGTKGPTDGSRLSNQQANQLFGKNYDVIEK